GQRQGPQGRAPRRATIAGLASLNPGISDTTPPKPPSTAPMIALPIRQTTTRFLRRMMSDGDGETSALTSCSFDLSFDITSSGLYGALDSPGRSGLVRGERRRRIIDPQVAARQSSEKRRHVGRVARVPGAFDKCLFVWGACEPARDYAAWRR